MLTGCQRGSVLLGSLLWISAAVLAAEPAATPATDGWITLERDEDWKNPLQQWMRASTVTLDPANPRKLTAERGGAILVNLPKGSAANLVSRQKFGDHEVHFEFLISKGSNSGVKFHGLYEIQILDSHGKDKLRGSDGGGIYPRAELLPRYRYLDEGIPPKTNACKPAGEWQTIDAVFLAPRFADGKKIANARLVKAFLNGKLIHEDVELKTPTGHAWTQPEQAEGPLLLQGDHGPVAFRNVRVKPLPIAAPSGR
jgi:hypothetical protein